MASKAPKTFDVSHPGKAPAAATSKPVIITNRPIVKDPTLVEDSPSEDQTTPAAKPKEAATSKVKIEPLSADVKPDTDDKPGTPADDKAAEQAVQDSIEDEDDPKAKSPNADDEDLAAKRAAEREAQLNKIAEAHTYYLPINQVVRRRSRHVAVAGLVLIVCLGIAWADISLDAGLISIPGVKAPTHFFDNK